ncbi:M20/M25/M40 family metallo-hydrolase [Methanogenium sp. S4BF]|uniref:M20/M25/M40 family metallo-hydrolase n=1 Tax=Methanogenium sp. S4BF TaxID=1789226 RepID=UPI002415F786|nr:M20/M25/M40 family metallo-hydrolase [Methanogenium sp. S4BF]WFN35031.1 M20/M25/M40 family metallo-hydrolase [Methanogenium sp. S4BF]
MDVAQVCSDLVQMNTENPPGRTDEAVEYVAGILEGLGYLPRISKNPGGHWNVCAGPRDAALLFCGHLDVVPAGDVGWTHDPFSGAIEDGYVWGRGSTDMKGGCAAILAALEAVIDGQGALSTPHEQIRSGDQGIPDRLDIRSQSDNLPVAVAFVCDEENGRVDGIQHLLREHEIIPCDCLVAEPTPYLNPSVGQKGLCRFRATFTGTPGHGSLYPFSGENAIVMASEFIHRMMTVTEKEYVPEAMMRELVTNSEEAISAVFPDTDVARLLTRITCNPGKIRGGEGTNIVAEECTVAMDMRLPWGCTPEAVLASVEKDPATPAVCTESLAAPTWTPPNSALVRRLCDAIEGTYDQPARPILQWAASDARFLRAAGFRAAEYGPGEIHLLHAQDERVQVEQLEEAVKVYSSLIRAYVLSTTHD